MAKKAQIVLNPDNLAPALETKVVRAREQFAKLDATDKENALRGVFLGGLFEEIKQEAGHGNFLALAKARLPDIPQERRNEMMRLWGVFVRETKVALPAAMAIPDAQMALALPGGDAGDEITKAALAFVGDFSLHALMQEHGVFATKKLGGKRTRAGGTAKPKPPTAEELAAGARRDISAAVEQLRQALVKDNLCRHLPDPEVRALNQNIEALLTKWRRGVKAALGE